MARATGARWPGPGPDQDSGIHEEPGAAVLRPRRGGPGAESSEPQ